MTVLQVLDAAGRRRSPATLPGFHRGRPPRNKGLQYPADPPTVEEIVAVMRCAGDQPYGLRSRALIVLLWRAGLRISEALSLAESDLDPSRGSVLVRHGKAASAARSGWTSGESAGINRHGEGDENALHRRRSESRWPRVMRWRSVRAQRSVDRGRAGGVIEPRNSIEVQGADAFPCVRKAILLAALFASRWWALRGRRSQACTTSSMRENREISWSPARCW
jgi:integrase